MRNRTHAHTHTLRTFSLPHRSYILKSTFMIIKLLLASETIGMIGEKGDTGSVGPPGPQGEKGMDNEQGNCNGTVYTRWGHDECPAGSVLVYNGTVGGSNFRNSGGGSNPLCLPSNPTYLSTQGGNQIGDAQLFGADYQTLEFSFGRHAHDHGAVCAVCFAPQKCNALMVPATHVCPDGWKEEYQGYLMSSQQDQFRLQYICVDEALKSGPTRATLFGRDALRLHFTEGVCGYLPCPPYRNNREISCSVCTK